MCLNVIEMKSSYFSTVAVACALLIGATLVPIPAKAVSVGDSMPLKAGQVFARLYVPRYGKTYVRKIAEGTSASVLNGPGLGHYTETQMPGDEGNFAIAGHRAANGGPMLKIDKLHAGDYAFVKTSDTWYTYKWLGTKVVKPTNVGVIYPIPVGLAGAASGGHYMTFTSCTPVHVNTFRIAAWFELEAEQPVSEGQPQLLTDQLK